MGTGITQARSCCRLFSPPPSTEFWKELKTLVGLVCWVSRALYVNLQGWQMWFCPYHPITHLSFHKNAWSTEPPLCAWHCPALLSQGWGSCRWILSPRVLSGDGLSRQREQLVQMMRCGLKGYRKQSSRSGKQQLWVGLRVWVSLGPGLHPSWSSPLMVHSSCRVEPWFGADPRPIFAMLCCGPAVAAWGVTEKLSRHELYIWPTCDTMHCFVQNYLIIWAQVLSSLIINRRRYYVLG